MGNMNAHFVSKLYLLSRSLQLSLPIFDKTVRFSQFLLKWHSTAFKECFFSSLLVWSPFLLSYQMWWQNLGMNESDRIKYFIISLKRNMWACWICVYPILLVYFIIIWAVISTWYNAVNDHLRRKECQIKEKRII